MTRATAAYRYSVFIVLLLSTACRPAPGDAASFRAVDLTRTLGTAEQRPAGGFELAAHEADGLTRPSIVMPVPARATWSLPMPRHGLFHAFLTVDSAGHPSAGAGAVARFRLGISDAHVYEELASAIPAGTGWTELRVDLSAYAGRKWSLFYRPDRITWRLVLATDAVGPGPVRAVWGSPEILTDPSSGQEYLIRRRALVH